MADIRKCVYALAVLALLFGSASTANAQAFQCVANAGVPAVLRAEGLTELNGEVTLNCNGVPSGWPVDPVTGAPTVVPGGGVTPPAGVEPARVNIQIFTTANVTSRLLTGTGISGFTESLLMIDDPGATAVTPCVGGAVYGPGSRCNAFQGQLISNNSILYSGVPVLPPGTPGTSRVYRIVNVRVNASSVAPGGFGTPGQVVTLISATPATGGTGPGGVISSSFPINNPQQITGFVQTGLVRSLTDNTPGGSVVAVGEETEVTVAAAFQQCVARTNVAVSGFARLRYAEGFNTSFKTRTRGQDPTATFPPILTQDVPGAIYNSESGYYNPLLGTLPNAGLADYGTRLRAFFTNVPAGIRLFVTVREVPVLGALATPAALRGALVSVTTGAEGGAFTPIAATATNYGFFGQAIGAGLCPGTGCAVAEIPITNGTGTAVWEIVTHDPLARQQIDFGVFATYTPDVPNNIPAAPAASQVSLSFAPISTLNTAQPASATIPRFVDLGTARNLFSTRICVTNLLFPFVTNQAGFDTGLAISNTSRDIFGTVQQTGTCTLNAFGANAPAAITTPVVTPDAPYVTVLSSSMPNFQGYVIAQCRFQFAHGFAFISDLGARNLAMGYLALIIPARGDNTRPANPFPDAGPGSGEQLGF